MSAADLLKEVKKLSPRQRRQFVRSVLALEQMPSAKKTRKPKKAPRKVKWPDILERASRVTGGRVLPNLVLLEREERSY
jgi:hypothetical protein